MTVESRDKNFLFYEGSKITVLENSVYYFLETVIIVIHDEGFRLLVSHQNQILTDCVYNSLRGAKIAFSRMYQEKAWKSNVKAIWTHEFPPDRVWLSEKIPGAKISIN